jgi:hypothetical protein
MPAMSERFISEAITSLRYPCLSSNFFDSSLIASFCLITAIYRKSVCKKTGAPHYNLAIRICFRSDARLGICGQIPSAGRAPVSYPWLPPTLVLKVWIQRYRPGLLVACLGPLSFPSEPGGLQLYLKNVYYTIIQ